MPTSRRKVSSVAPIQPENHDFTFERPPLDVPDMVDEMGDRCVVVEARGGKQWMVIVDTPGGHFDDRMRIVPGLERAVEEEEDEGEDEAVAKAALGDSIVIDSVFQSTQNVEFGSESESGDHGKTEEKKRKSSKKNKKQKQQTEQAFDPFNTDPVAPEPLPSRTPSKPKPLFEKGPHPGDHRAAKQNVRQAPPPQQPASFDDSGGELLEGFGARPQQKGVQLRRMVRKNKFLKGFIKQKTTLHETSIGMG